MYDSPAVTEWVLGGGRRERRTVTRMQCASLGSPLSSAPTRSARRAMSLTRTTLMSLSKQNAWMSVKWICSAMSHSYSSSVASTQNATLSGSLRVEREGDTRSAHVHVKLMLPVPWGGEWE